METYYLLLGFYGFLSLFFALGIFFILVMDVKIDICRKAEWDPNFLDRIPMTDEELKETEARLLNDLNVYDDYSLFLYGQFFYEKGDYEKAFHYFEIMANRGNYQSKYQAAMMCYDGLGTELNMKLGFQMMEEIAMSSDPEASHLYQAAALNVGRAYFYGCGVARSEELAEKYWKQAAEGEQDTEACTQAQTILGLFYTLPDHRNLDLAFRYHSLAGEKGSLESQGALAVMFINGMGVKRAEEKGYKLLRKASSKGSIYAKGNLVKYYYNRKLFTKASDLATEVVDITDVKSISESTGCLEHFIKMGISIACFHYARCLALGRGVPKNECHASTYYKKSFEYDKKICNELQKLVLYGII